MVGSIAVLVARVGTLACAFPIEHVVEAMRPLPIEPIGGAGAATPDGVTGVALVRGAAIPVVDLGQVLGIPTGPGTRFVVVRVGDRSAALVVDEVVGVRTVPATALAATPPLLAGAAREAVAGIGALDRALLLVLEAARLIPEEPR